MSAILSEYVGKRVVITAKGDDGSAYQIDGTVQLANEGGIIIKPKGKTNVTFIEIDNIIEGKLSDAVPTAKKLKAKLLRNVELGQARTHLLDRHGYKVSDINAMSEEEALDFHNSLDHEGLDLGHKHGDKAAAETPAETPAAETPAE